MSEIDDILNQDVGKVEKPKDFVGGGGFIKDSDVYLMKVKHAYVVMSKAGAMGVAFTMQHNDDKKTEFNQTAYISTNKQNGSRFTYERNGQSFFLPNHIILLDMLKMATGDNTKSVKNAVKVTKSIELYDYAKAAKVPTEVEVFDELTGAVFNVGLLKKVKNKFSKEGEVLAETKEINEIGKIFSKAQLTQVEIEAGKTEPSNINAWLENNQGKVISEVQKVGATASAHSGSGSSTPAAQSAEPTDDIFGED